MKGILRKTILFLLFFLPSFGSGLLGMSCNIHTLHESGFFELVEDVDLKGGVVNLPKNLTVLFKGGVFRNGQIVCDNTLFMGVGGLSPDVLLTGTVNGAFDLGWYELVKDDPSFDIGPIINQVASSFDSFIVPFGTFFFKTPIFVVSAKHVVVYGDLCFNGSSKDVTSLTFKDSVSATIDLRGELRYVGTTKTINYTNKNQSNITGVDFVNIKQSNISVSKVCYFNTNMKVSAWGDGNSYNQYHLGLLYYSNKQLHVYQKNWNSKKGWCNENIFYGGRLSNPSEFNQRGYESYAIYIEGDKDNDSYNHVNSLLFLKPCTEGYKQFAVYAKNTHQCQWLYGRNEGSQGYIMFDGDCRGNDIQVSYGSADIDITNCTTYPLVINKWNLLQVAPDLDYSDKSVYEFDTDGIRFVKVDFPSSSGRVGVVYLDNNELELKTSTAPKTLSDGSFFYSSSNKMWMNGAPTSSCSFYIFPTVRRIRLVVFDVSKRARISVAL